jgi:uncharacterized protein YndB with AHSA1/START domain
VQIKDEVVVNAPVAEVWNAIKDPALHAEWHPYVTRISGEHTLGATRTCSVLAGKKGGETKERCIEDDEEQRLIWAIEEDSTGFSRMVSDWRAGFVLWQRNAATHVAAQSTFVPRNPLVRVMSPIIRRKFHQAQRNILASLKDAVEGIREEPGSERGR